MRRREPVRVFYFAPVDGSGTAGKHADVPSIRNKVLGVCGALRTAGATPVVVSTLGSGGHTSLARPIRIGRRGRVGFAHVFAFGSRGGRRIVASLSFLVFTMAAVRRRDTVLLYNYFPEYVLAAAWLRLIGRPSVMDVEDAPRHDERGLRRAMNHWTFPVFLRLTARKKIVASQGLAEATGLREFLPVYGVSSYFTTTSPAYRPFSGDTLNINFGGTMLHDTGVDLFKAALVELATSERAARFHFFITGDFGPEVFGTFAKDIEERSGMRISLLPGLGGAEYRDLMSRMDVGLCLKLASSFMGQTTFPSKVVEISAMGKLLVTTSVSDVPLIFSDRTAYLLRSEEPAELASVFLDVDRDRVAAAERARLGQAEVVTRFSASAVGRGMLDFLAA